VRERDGVFLTADEPNPNPNLNPNSYLLITSRTVVFLTAEV
jgi:hypothetical protein